MRKTIKKKSSRNLKLAKSIFHRKKIPTMKDNKLFLHVMTPETNAILVPAVVNIKDAKEFASNKKLDIKKFGDHYVVNLDQIPDSPDYIIECSLK